jgi:hypothetical protein
MSVDEPGPRPLVDRVVSRLGARAVVDGRPGLGYLLIEVVPCVVWMQITGALSQDFFYFITFLTLLGADNRVLEGLLLVTTAGGVAQGALVLSRPPTDPKWICVRDTLIGRILWLGTVLWPLALWWLWPAEVAPGWRPWALYGGVLAIVFAATATHNAGGSAFVSWTQALVPRGLRGRFYAWRNLAGFLATAVTLLAVNLVFPRAHAGDPAQLPWLGGLLLTVTVMCIASSWWLAQVPGPTTVVPRAHAPLWPLLRTNLPYLRLAAYAMLNSAAVAASAAFQPKLWQDAGADVALMAHWQALAQYPAMFAGAVMAGWLLPRLHGRVLLLGGHALLITSEIGLLTLAGHPSTLPWLMPIILVGAGLARATVAVAAISRLQEIAPPGDVRFPAIYTALFSLVAMVMAMVVIGDLGWLETDWGRARVPWILVASGVVLRVLALLPLAWPDRSLGDAAKP